MVSMIINTHEMLFKKAHRKKNQQQQKSTVVDEWCLAWLQNKVTQQPLHLKKKIQLYYEQIIQLKIM